MSDLKLFQAKGAALTEFDGSLAPLEKALQTSFETALHVRIGTRSLAILQFYEAP